MQMTIEKFEKVENLFFGNVDLFFKKATGLVGLQRMISFCVL